jgi:hypothetical protein
LRRRRRARDPPRRGGHHALGLPAWADLLVEYAAGFGFGWTIFQALFMKDMASGSYRRSLGMTFLPELVSMNGLMAGMAAVSVPWRQAVPGASGPGDAGFWFIYCVALTAGFAVSYPLNWWLVSAGLKHGMMTVRPGGQPVALAGGLALAGAALASSGASHAGPHGGKETAGQVLSRSLGPPEHAGHPGHRPGGGGGSPPAERVKVAMVTLSFAVLALGLLVAGTAGSLTAR